MKPMPSTTSINRGDIFLLDTQFTDWSGSKIRPTVIMSAAAYHRGRKDVVGASLTTQLNRRLTGIYPLADWANSGLDEPSATSGQIVTTSRFLLGRRVGQVSARDLAGIESALRQIFGLGFRQP